MVRVDCPLQWPAQPVMANHDRDEIEKAAPERHIGVREYRDADMSSS